MLSLIFLGTKLVEEKRSEVRAVYILGSALLVYKTDIWKPLVKSYNSLPIKVNTIFNSCSIRNASNMSSLTVLVVS